MTQIWRFGWFHPIIYMLMVGKGRYLWVVGSVVVPKDETAVGTLIVVLVIHLRNSLLLYQRNFFFEF